MAVSVGSRERGLLAIFLLTDVDLDCPRPGCHLDVPADYRPAAVALFGEYLLAPWPSDPPPPVERAILDGLAHQAVTYGDPAPMCAHLTAAPRG